MKLSTTKIGVLMMLVAAGFWGFMGISSRFLNEVQCSAADISFIRSITAAVLLTITYAFTKRSVFRVTFRQFLFCAFYGVLNFTIGFALYSLSVSRIPISVATVLMFSNPIWVTLFGYIFFKDKVGLKKIVLIATCILGCMCIIDIFSTGGTNLDIIGVIAGILNGMTFAMQIVLPRFVENRISKDSILLYGFWTSAICLVFFTDMPAVFRSIASSGSPVFFTSQILTIGVLCTYISNSCYVNSTKYIGTSLPSMMVALEPVFASIFAFFIFGENMKSIQILGSAIVIISVIALELNTDRIMSLFKKRHRSA